MFNAYRNVIFLALALVFVILHPLQAYANPSCDSSGGNYTAQGSVQMARDAPIGSNTTALLASGREYYIACTMVSSGEYSVYFKVTVDSAPVDGFTDVYPTDTPGIGVRFHFRDDSDLCEIQYGDTIDNSSRVFKCTLSPTSTPMALIYSAVELVKTSNDFYGGQIRKLPIVKTSYHIDDQVLERPLSDIWNGSDSISVDITSCSLSTYAASVDLADVPDSSFTGEGSTAGDKAFTVSMDCSFGININVTLHGVQNADTSDTSVLALTNAGTAGTASGLGVQILSNDIPLKLDETIKVMTAIDGHEDLSFVARYIQTKPSLGAGTANTVATLELTYQ
ncbi:fimbrial protein [Lelliottia sp. CFBP8978]|jgi:type 1 fimbria pilin|uniref:fimbrial protein n=1 Tax=Lelliottia sp. CFBP8978 TaxID=3096522 RepID=UPI002A6A97BC|nr:fimbrial protein [Lelliottia sp. CFBP8978]MDY1038553.1 fimbrial protein [Lelliottia sp. CFBP8978]